MIFIEIYLKDKDDVFEFPVAPLDAIKVNRSKIFKTVDIIDKGEFDVLLKGNKIKEISFSTLLPCKYDNYCNYIRVMDPKDAINKLEKLMNLQTPLRLIITGGFGLNELVVISNFEEEERAGEIKDRYITITFRTYRDLKIEKVPQTVAKKATQLNNNRPSAKKGYSSGDIVVVTADALHVRSGPGTSYSSLGFVYQGNKLKIYKTVNNWADVFWGNHGGWICTDYVKK